MQTHEELKEKNVLYCFDALVYFGLESIVAVNKKNSSI